MGTSEAGVGDLPDHRENLRALALFGTDLGEPVRALVDDQRDIGPGFDVVQDARLAPETLDVGTDVLRPGLAHPALEGRHERRRFAADEGSGSLVHLDREIEARAQNVFSEQTVLLGQADGDMHVLDRQRILLPDVDVAFVSADGIGSEGQTSRTQCGLPSSRLRSI